ncbi:hypothetical protein HRbin01_00437 [archaeon HR01]|nr:hypothetical protein HRbin01_00437 [archaeon HR01]
MTASMLRELYTKFTDVAKLNELEYLNTPVKVKILRDIEKITVAGRVYEDLKAGSILTIFLWVGEKLVENHVAEFVDKPINLTHLYQIEWRERNNPADLQPLGKFFYCEARRAVRVTGSEEMGRKLLDIMTLRLMKIVQLAAKRIGGEVLRKMTPEEQVLYENIYGVVGEWMESVSPVR